MFGQFLLGATGNATGFLTQTNQSVVSTNGGFLVANDRASTSLGNIAASATQGGVNSVLPQVQENIQGDRQSVFVLNSGQQVELYVTQPFSLSI